jgi:hypothetical protein
MSGFDRRLEFVRCVRCASLRRASPRRPASLLRPPRLPPSATFFLGPCCSARPRSPPAGSRVQPFRQDPGLFSRAFALALGAGFRALLGSTRRAPSSACWPPVPFLAFSPLASCQRAFASTWEVCAGLQTPVAPGLATGSATARPQPLGFRPPAPRLGGWLVCPCPLPRLSLLRLAPSWTVAPRVRKPALRLRLLPVTSAKTSTPRKRHSPALASSRLRSRLLLSWRPPQPHAPLSGFVPDACIQLGPRGLAHCYRNPRAVAPVHSIAPSLAASLRQLGVPLPHNSGLNLTGPFLSGHPSQPWYCTTAAVLADWKVAVV